MVELTGGPADGVKYDFGDKPHFTMFESRTTCDNREHDEFRFHRYNTLGCYVGASKWMTRDRVKQTK
jgi:hypothetical protein